MEKDRSLGSRDDFLTRLSLKKGRVSFTLHHLGYQGLYLMCFLDSVQKHKFAKETFDTNGRPEYTRMVLTEL